MPKKDTGRPHKFGPQKPIPTDSVQYSVRTEVLQQGLQPQRTVTLNEFNNLKKSNQNREERLSNLIPAMPSLRNCGVLTSRCATAYDVVLTLLLEWVGVLRLSSCG